MEGYGLVRLERGERGRITPKVMHDRVELDLPLTLSRKASCVMAAWARAGRTLAPRPPSRLAQRAEVADRVVRIIGSKSNLLQTLTAAAGVKPATPGVRVLFRRGGGVRCSDRNHPSFKYVRMIGYLLPIFIPNPRRALRSCPMLPVLIPRIRSGCGPIETAPQTRSALRGKLGCHVFWVAGITAYLKGRRNPRKRACHGGARKFAHDQTL
jgi:hypothetical protein